MQEAKRAYWFVGPATGMVAAVALAPLAVVIWLSFHRVLPVLGVDRWAGGSNYVHLVSDGRFWSSLATTIYFAVVSVVLEIALGLGIALLLHRRFHGRGLLRSAVLVPWVLPTVVAARMWEWIFHPDLGILNHVLRRLSLLSQSVSWLGEPFWAIHAAIIADAWKTTPFAVLILLAGLAAIPPDLARAARVDGASPGRVFLEITLPLLRPALAVAALFRFLDAMRVFDTIYVLTGGGPANTTETLAIYIYKLMFQTLRFGYGATVAVATALVAAAASVALIRVGARGALEGGQAP